MFWCFSVCVPVKQCVTQSGKCKRVPKLMPVELWQRELDGRLVYDVYIINSPDVNSNFDAGGMPAKWVILHCETLDDVEKRFPGAVSTGGKPMPGDGAMKSSAKVRARTQST